MKCRFDFFLELKFQKRDILEARTPLMIKYCMYYMNFIKLDTRNWYERQPYDKLRTLGHMLGRLT